MKVDDLLTVFESYVDSFDDEPLPHVPGGRVLVRVRKHPAGIWQPTGKFKVTKMEKRGNKIFAGIGKDGKGGWEIDPLDPHTFIDFIVPGYSRPVDVRIAYKYFLKSTGAVQQ